MEYIIEQIEKILCKLGVTYIREKEIRQTMINIHQGLLSEFEKGFDYVKDYKRYNACGSQYEQDALNAEKHFKNVAMVGERLIELGEKIQRLSSYINEFSSLYKIYDIVATACKNLSSMHDDNKEKREFYYNLHIKFYQDKLYFADVYHGYNDEEYQDNYYPFFKIDLRIEPKVKAMGYLMELDFSNYYMKTFCTGKYKWYNYFTYFQNEGKLEKPFFEIGRFLCNRLNTNEVQEFLYTNNFFKMVALDWAYSNLSKEKANEIIKLCYDHYLEIESLYLIYKYDCSNLLKEVLKLKVICLKRNLKILEEGRDYSIPYPLKDVYGEEFCSYIKDMMEFALSQIDQTDENDYRNHEEKKVFKFN